MLHADAVFQQRTNQLLSSVAFSLSNALISIQTKINFQAQRATHSHRLSATATPAFIARRAHSNNVYVQTTECVCAHYEGKAQISVCVYMSININQCAQDISRADASARALCTQTATAFLHSSVQSSSDKQRTSSYVTRRCSTYFAT